jgi:hypothetical protein
MDTVGHVPELRKAVPALERAKESGDVAYRAKTDLSEQTLVSSLSRWLPLPMGQKLGPSWGLQCLMGDHTST